MLSVDLGQLRREGAVLVEARVPSDDPVWQETDLVWADGVEAKLTASFAGTGEVVVRGRADGTLEQQCRRCLKPVRTEVGEDVTLVFVSDSDEDFDGDAYAFDWGRPKLELKEAVREELILAINPYVVCDPECRGLCPTCGTNLNEGSCDCTVVESDPRWEALRALKDE